MSPMPPSAPKTPQAQPPGSPGQRLRQRLQRASHSLRTRLLGVFLLLALGSSLLFFAGTRELFSTGWRELARPLVADYLDHLAAEIGSPPDLDRAQAITRRVPLSIRIDGPVLHWASHPQRGPEGGRGAREAGDARWRDWLQRRSADGHVIRFGLGDWRWDDRPRWHAWALIAGLLALTALAYAFVRRLLRPLDDIHAGALRYGQGDFSQPIPLRRRDELGELARQVNAMASGLRHMLEGQRSLLLAISHELRSPLTRARLHAELLADGTERSALLRDLGQMRDLISDLLESERLAAGPSALQRQPTDLNALAQAVVDEQFAGRGVHLQLDATLPPLPLDPVRLRLLVRNLLDNALRHGGGAAVQLSTQRRPDAAWLTVQDAGPGVPPAQLPRLAEAFYRPDAARSRSAGGVGLGLYLCRRVAQSHGGELRLADAAPGLAVSLVLPLADGAAAPAAAVNPPWAPG